MKEKISYLADFFWSLKVLSVELNVWKFSIFERKIGLKNLDPYPDTMNLHLKPGLRIRITLKRDPIFHFYADPDPIFT